MLKQPCFFSIGIFFFQNYVFASIQLYKVLASLHFHVHVRSLFKLINTSYFLGCSVIRHSKTSKNLVIYCSAFETESLFSLAFYLLVICFQNYVFAVNSCLASYWRHCILYIWYYHVIQIFKIFLLIFYVDPTVFRFADMQ